MTGNDIVRTLKKTLVAFGADETSFSETTKGLKRGYFRCKARSIGGEEEHGWRKNGGRWLVCISVLCVCFLVSVLIVKGCSGVVDRSMSF